MCFSQISPFSPSTHSLLCLIIFSDGLSQATLWKSSYHHSSPHPCALVFHSIHHSLEVLSSMERRKNFPVSASSSLRSETLPCSPGTQNSACSFDRCQVCAGIAHVFLSVQRNHIWGVSEDIPEMTTFELSFEGYIGFCHVRNWMLQTQR